MTFEDYNEAKDNFQNILIKIDSMITVYRKGSIEGFAISKPDVMDKAKLLKIELLSAWNTYKSELQNLVT